MIETRNLVKAVNTSEGRLIILNGVSLLIESGEAVAIVGASGSGKSTLLGLMAGLDGVTSGDVILDGHNLTQMDEEQRAILRGQLVGFVFQSFQLLPSLTALENVMLPIELKGDPEPNKKANQLLERVGLEERWHHYPNQLSGGQHHLVHSGGCICCRTGREPFYIPPARPADQRAVAEVEYRRHLEHSGTTVGVERCNPGQFHDFRSCERRIGRIHGCHDNSSYIGAGRFPRRSGTFISVAS